MTDADRLADAQDKLHALLTGRLSVEVVIDGRTVRYSRANVTELRAYIAELEARIAGCKTAGAIGITYFR